MKNYRLVYEPEKREKRFLFTNIDMKRLDVPVSISREKHVPESVVFGLKKKSEQVIYEDEAYKKLLEKEGNPLILEDCEGKMFIGKMQNLGVHGLCYFIFINNGELLRVVPIRKWYRFCQKQQPDILQGNTEKSVEDDIAADVNTSEEEEEVEDVDFDERFDDDNDEEAGVFIVREKKLSRAGRKMRSIMENYEKHEECSNEGNLEEDDKKSAQPVVAEALTREKIREMFKGKVSLRDLLKKVKTNFNFGDGEKELMKEFIGENCVLETDSTSGEKYLSLKK